MLRNPTSPTLLVLLLASTLAACGKSETPTTSANIEPEKKAEARAPATSAIKPEPKKIEAVAPTDKGKGNGVPIASKDTVKAPPITAPAEAPKPVETKVASVSPVPPPSKAGVDFADDSVKLPTGDPNIGKEKSELCQGCHGEEGDASEPLVPKLAGQYSRYIAKQLRNYQAGTRSHQVMSDMASTINDNELADIAAYFANQKKMKGNSSVNNPLGKKLFIYGDNTKNAEGESRKLAGCQSCHGINGKGVAPTTPMFPVIGGQNREYLKEQLINFKKGERSNSPNAIMNKIASSLSDAEIDAVSDYASGL